ncbi:MAG: rane protein [Geobacteraceae bacterium]|nr:rane protein [Geobacteraceae bacterium]
MSHKQPFLNKLLVGLLLTGFFVAAAYSMRHTFSITLLSFVLAYLLDPPVVFLERRKLKRVYGIVILYSILCIFALFSFTYVLPFFTLHWEALLRDLPVYAHEFQSLMNGWRVHMKLPYAANEWNWLLNTIQTNLDSMFAKLGTGVYTMAGRVAINLLNVLLSPVLAFFMLYYKEDIRRAVRDFLPAAKREFFFSIGHDIDRSIGGFIRGQIGVSVIVAVLSIVPLIAMDINHPFFCAVFAGFASVIPFVGVILATIPPLFFAYAEYQNLTILLKIVAAFSVIYFLEGYVIKPIVFKESLDLNPLVTIIIVMALGELIGFWGVILAIPIAAAAKIIYRHFMEYNSRARADLLSFGKK